MKREGFIREENFDTNLYRNDTWQWTEQWDCGEVTATRQCQWSGPGCHQGCSLIYYTKDNKLIGVEGDPQSPVTEGRLCMRCLDLVEMVNHPMRQYKPLKLVGERGSNEWEEISWEEAYQLVVDWATEITEKYGSKCITTGHGTGRNANWQTASLAFAGFKTANDNAGMLSGDACYTPRLMAMNALFGCNLIADMGQFVEKRFDDPRYRRPDLCIIWGCNPVISNSDGFFGHWVIDCMRRGMKLVTVDPRLTWLAAQSEVWIQIRPATDGAVALAILHVMIEEGLYDAEFVDKWTYGFDELAAHVADWTPERAAEIAWTDPEQIRKAARLIGTLGVQGTCTLQWGLKLDQQKHGVPAAHGVACIEVLTGSIDVPGGWAAAIHGYDVSDIRETVARKYADEIKDARLGDDLGALRRVGHSPHSSADATMIALEEGEPYPIKMVYLCSTNPIACMGADSKRIYEGFMNAEHIVVCDLFLTPTAVALADLFLPVSMSPERNGLRAWFTPLRSINKILDAGTKSDEELMLAIGKIMRPEAFPWADTKEMVEDFMHHLDTIPGSSDFSFDELRERVYIYPEFNYEKYQKGMLRKDGKPGFNTATGRIELFCTMYAMAGLDGLPGFHEPTESPVSAPELFEEYPLVLSTGRRTWEFFHSEHRQPGRLRDNHPDPLVEINTEDAAALGIKTGDWVWVENQRGRIKQKAVVEDTILKGVVMAEHAWWFPEREPRDTGNGCFDVYASNANVLTVMCDQGPSGYGAPYSGLLCKVYKVEE